MTDFLCLECGAGRVRPIEHAHYTSRYGVIPALAAEEPIAIPTCSHCGEEFTGPADHARLEAALKPAYGRELQRRAIEALDRLTARGVPQREVEKLLDLSPGYLSKVRSEKAPSALLVAALALLANRPEPRRRELEAFWHRGAVAPSAASPFAGVHEVGTVLFDGPTAVPQVPNIWRNR